MSTIYNDNIFLIYIKQEIGEKHKENHVYVKSGDQEFSFLLNDLNEIIKQINRSKLSKRNKKLLKAIMSIYQEEMNERCIALNNGKPVQMLDSISIRETRGQIGSSLTESARLDECHIIDIKPQPDHSMLLLRRNGEVRIFDFKPVLQRERWSRPLRSLQYFMSARLDKSFRNSIYWGNYDIELDIDDIDNSSEPV